MRCMGRTLRRLAGRALRWQRDLAMARCLALCLLLQGCAFSIDHNTVCHFRVKAIKCRAAF
jgi:hypothetical protein